jgi:hypothetical protein
VRRPGDAWVDPIAGVMNCNVVLSRSFGRPDIQQYKGDRAPHDAEICEVQDGAGARALREAGRASPTSQNPPLPGGKERRTGLLSRLNGTGTPKPMPR